MREQVRKVLRCPACCDVVMQTRSRELGTPEGFYCKKCDLVFPIIDGVPCMMISQAGKEPAATSFGFQWLARERGFFETDTLYGLTKEEEILAFLNAYDIQPGDLKNKTVLDAGCGDGALLELLAGFAAEVIGIDINTSITIPYQRCRSFPNVTVLQADVCRPCFQPGSIDFVWCEGVVVATPNPLQAFRAISRLVKPGGQLYIWVYPSERLSIYQRIRDLLIMPYLLPRPILIYLCYGLATALYPILHATGRKRTLRTLAFDLFDNLSPRYQWRYTEQEVRAWFTEAGFGDLRVTGRIGMSGKRRS